MRGAFPSILRGDPQPRPSRLAVEEMKAALMSDASRMQAAPAPVAQLNCIVPRSSEIVQRRPGGILEHSNDGMHRESSFVWPRIKQEGKKDLEPPKQSLSASVVKQAGTQQAPLNALAKLAALMANSSDTVKRKMEELSAASSRHVVSSNTAASWKYNAQSLDFITRASHGNQIDGICRSPRSLIRVTDKSSVVSSANEICK